MSTPGEHSTGDPSPEPGHGDAPGTSASSRRSSAESGAPSAPWGVKFEVFEGPLDLLLHLIRQNDLDIQDIPIALLAEQYLEYLDLMRELDIDIAAEYLLMAATLAHIKSRMLLPPDGEESEEVEDPRTELARRLAAYAAFQEVARELGSRDLLDREVFAGLPDADSLPEREAELSVSLFGLVEALKAVLDRLPAETYAHEVTLETITVRDRMLFVMDRLRDAAGKPMSFEEMLTDSKLSRMRVVLTFLAILELARIQALRIYQHVGPEGRPAGPVRLRAAVLPDDLPPDSDESADETESLHVD